MDRRVQLNTLGRLYYCWRVYRCFYSSDLRGVSISHDILRPWPLLTLRLRYLQYLVDVYLMYAASAIAANTIARSAAGAAAPLFTDYMFTALGVGGGGSLVGGVALLLAPIPFLFYRYGKAIRIKSKFSPTHDRGDEGEKKEQPREDRRRSELSASSEEQLELDEEAGVPVKDFSDQDGENEKSLAGTPTTPRDEAGDRFLDASGLEKAERIPNQN